ncbi:MAG: type II toxin-antitoxin system RelE/ParE family toxin [Lachnospiraceae bacterium]|nr:type II toxin-antitoxin system RelE/ParE family toxin [Lachnospiraceae bacterium]
MTIDKYRVIITKTARYDIQDIKRHIREVYKNYQLAEDFSKKIKKAILGLELFPKRNSKTEFTYREYNIYLRISNAYLIFYIIEELNNEIIVLKVIQNRMNWKYYFKQWLITNE